jgi:hypothetical protein
MLSLTRTPMHPRCQSNAAASNVFGSHRKHIVSARAIPTQAGGSKQEAGSEIDRLKSKLDQQSSLLQKLLSEKENAAKYTGVLETPYFALKDWSYSPAADDDKQQLIKEVKIIQAKEPLPAISIRSLPLRQLYDNYTTRTSDSTLVMGIEICSAGCRYAEVDAQRPFTVKKGSIMRLEDLQHPFDSCPVKIQLENDVMGSLSFNHRVQCVWTIPMKTFKSNERLMPLLPSSLSLRPYNSRYHQSGSTKDEPGWRVSFELIYAFGAAE